MSILDSIPDISFIGDISVEKLKEIGINEYKSALSEITGETVTQISDEDTAKIYAQAQIMYQVAEIINNRARQNSLKYASGAYLDKKAKNFIQLLVSVFNFETTTNLFLHHHTFNNILEAFPQL